MATKDFRASQIETSKIIGTGSIDGTTAGIAIYSGSISSNREGGVSDSKMFDNVGTDVFLFVSGAISNDDNDRTDATLFGGDVVVSGTLYAERQVIEVDSVADGDFFVTGSMFVRPDTDSDRAVEFRKANNSRILTVNTNAPNVDIDGALILSGNIHAGASDGNLTINSEGEIILNANSDTDGVEFIRFNFNGNQYHIFSEQTGVIFNQARQTAQDFTVSGDNDHASIFVDAGEDAIALGWEGSTTPEWSELTETGTDVKILLSGTVGSRGGSTRGTTLVAGDLVISGNLHGGSPLKVSDDIALTGSARFKEQSAPSAGPSEAILYAKDDSGVTKLFTRQSDGTEVGPLGSGGSLNDAYDTPDGGGTKSAGIGAVITVDGQPVQIVRNSPGDIVLGVTGSAIFGETSAEFANHLPPLPGDDTMFFFSGSIDSTGLDTGGVTTFGGDAVISGALGVNTVKITSDGKLGIGMTNPNYKLSVGGNAEFGEFLYHRGDTDTFIQFADDSIGLTAGNVQLVTIAEDTQDIVKIGDGTDVDFQVRTLNDDNTLYVQGSSDRVGIGTNAPDSILHVKEAGPTITIQRESNANNSTIEFVGQAGATANMVHLATTNDLVFSTHDGVDQEEILRLGSHYGSDLRQVILLSGSALHPGAMHPKDTSDINFFVSGAIGSRSTSTRGTSLFGGDLVSSGTISKVDETGNASVTLDGPGVILSPGTIVEFGDPGENIFGNGIDLIISSSNSVHVIADGPQGLKVTGHLSSSNGFSTQVAQSNTTGIAVATSLSEVPVAINTVFNADLRPNEDVKGLGSDVGFFVSGSRDKKGVIESQSTALFAGDVVASGTIRQQGSLHIYNHFLSTATSDKFFSPFRPATNEANADLDNSRALFTMAPFGGSLERVTIASRLGGTAQYSVSLYVNGVLGGVMTGSTESGATAYGSHTGIRKATFDFTGGSSIEVSGSNTFAANDLVSFAVVADAVRDVSVTTVFRINDIDDPPGFIFP